MVGTMVTMSSATKGNWSVVDVAVAVTRWRWPPWARWIHAHWHIVMGTVPFGIWQGVTRRVEQPVALQVLIARIGETRQWQGQQVHHAYEEGQ